MINCCGANNNKSLKYDQLSCELHKYLTLRLNAADMGSNTNGFAFQSIFNTLRKYLHSDLKFSKKLMKSICI